MPEPVRLVIDGARMEELLRGPDGPVVMYLVRLSDATIAMARIRIHNHTGKLARSIVKRPVETEAGPGMLIIAGQGLQPGYAIWVHDGNGPPGGRITPKRSRVLAWVTSGERPTEPAGWAAARASGRAIIRPSVATSTPNPFLRDSLERTLPIVR